MSQKKISKDLLSLVSRQFFKEIKQKYRTIVNFSTLVIYVIKFFETQGDIMISSLHCYSHGGASSLSTAMVDTDLQINQSYMQFMVMRSCDFLVEEHNRFMYTLVKKTNFLLEENMAKFKYEIVLFNHFSSVLAHIEFDQCKYYA